MANIITAFSKPEDAKSIKGILARNGYESAFICTSGAQVLSAAEDLDSGIVVCGFRFEDMIYEELRQMLPSAFDMLMIASPAKWSGQKREGIVYLPMPLKVHDLLCTMEMMVQARRRLRRRERSQTAKLKRAGPDRSGKGSFNGTKRHDRGRGAPLYPKMQHG